MAAFRPLIAHNARFIAIGLIGKLLDARQHERGRVANRFGPACLWALAATRDGSLTAGLLTEVAFGHCRQLCYTRAYADWLSGNCRSLGPVDGYPIGRDNIAVIILFCQYIMMVDELTFARTVQAGYFVSGVGALLTFYLGLGGTRGMALALAITMPFTFLVMFRMRCKSCGVSYFFDPNSSGRYLVGVNLFKPVKRLCPNCGATR